MKQTFFTALVFGLLLTACAPRPAMSLTNPFIEGISESDQPRLLVQHSVAKTDGTVPTTQVVNLISGDTAQFTEKRHFSEIEKGQLIQFHVSLEGYVSKVYTVDTRNLQDFETLIVEVTSLAPGHGTDSLPTICMGDNPVPGHFNNQPVVIHPRTSLHDHQ